MPLSRTRTVQASLSLASGRKRPSAAGGGGEAESTARGRKLSTRAIVRRRRIAEGRPIAKARRMAEGRPIAERRRNAAKVKAAAAGGVGAVKGQMMRALGGRGCAKALDTYAPCACAARLAIRTPCAGSWTTSSRTMA